MKQIDSIEIQPHHDNVSLEELRSKLNEAIDLINEQQKTIDKLKEHCHEYVMGDELTDTPLVPGQNDEGQDVWEPLVANM